MAEATKTTRSPSPARATATAPAPASDRQLGDIRSLIESAREQTARAVNAALVGLHWSVGKRIRKDILHEKRAEYGEQIVQTLSEQLTREYGQGFDRRNLFPMNRFAEVFPDEAIVNALRTQWSWTHVRELIAITDPRKRDFYAEMCRIEHGSSRTLRHKIGHLLAHRRRG